MMRDGQDRSGSNRSSAARWCGRTLAWLAVAVLAASCSTATPPNIPLQWDYVREKQRRVPTVREYVTIAEDHLAKGNFMRARWNFRKAYKNSRSLTNRGLCKLGVALAYYGSTDFMLAAETLDETIRLYGNFIPFEQVLSLEYDIARNRFHRKRDLLWATLDDNALEVYRNLQRQAPYHPIAEQALFSAGLLEMERGKLDESVGLFSQFLNRYDGSKYEIEARLNMAQCLLALAKLCEGDPLLEGRARAELKKVDVKVATEDQKNRWKDLRKLNEDVKADQLIFLGSFYQRAEHWNPEGSRRYLNQFLLNYPTHPRMDEVKRLLAGLPPEKPDDEGEKP